MGPSEQVMSVLRIESYILTFLIVVLLSDVCWVFIDRHIIAALLF